MKNLLIVAVVTVASAFSFLTCSCKNEVMMGKEKKQMSVDSVMYQVFGDSIGELLLSSKDVRLFVLDAMNDSITQEKSLRFRKVEKGILHFILNNPSNCQSDKVVYGRFTPSFRVMFKKGKRSCLLNFDFGLRKWNLCDEEGRELRRFDLMSDEMLRFAYSQFPECEFFSLILKAERK